MEEKKIEVVKETDVDQALKDLEDIAVEQKKIEMSKIDFCPACMNQASDGAIQPYVPIPVAEDQVKGIGLPFLVCLKCCNVYMPRTFINTMTGQVEEEEEAIEVVKPRIITPE